jgi:hypothetical protein
MSNEFTAQQIADAAKKPRAMAKESSVLVCDVAALDGSGERNVDFAAMRAVGDLIVADAPGTLFMLIAAGANKCTLFVHTPSKANINGPEWLKACIQNGTVEMFSEITAGAFEEHECPLKYKDELMSRAFAYLRSQNAMTTDEDSEDDGPKLWDLE